MTELGPERTGAQRSPDQADTHTRAAHSEGVLRWVDVDRLDFLARDLVHVASPADMAARIRAGEEGPWAELVRALLQTRTARELIGRTMADYWAVAAEVSFERWPSALSGAAIAEQERREEVEAILAKACDARDAEELDDRLAWIIDLKSLLDQAIEGARERGERDYKHALVKIKWAAQLSYAEDMTETQREGLVGAAELLQGDQVDRETAREISRVLRAHDLDYIPDLEQSVSGDE